MQKIFKYYFLFFFAYLFLSSGISFAENSSSYKEEYSKLAPFSKEQAEDEGGEIFQFTPSFFQIVFHVRDNSNIFLKKLISLYIAVLTWLFCAQIVSILCYHHSFLLFDKSYTFLRREVLKSRAHPPTC